MINNKHFNIFRTLEKDDKELIHSSFVCFLMNDYKEFYKKVLDLEYSIEFLKNTNANIEVSLGKRYGRADILVEDPVNIIIENKFKSFPSEEQLEKYDKKFPDNANTHKYLLTFEKSIVNLNEKLSKSWKIIDYKKILEFCENVISSELNPDKRIFIEHYISFLTEYVLNFKKLSTNSEYLKSKLNFYDKNSTFWKVIIFNLIKTEIEHKIDKNEYSVSVFSGRQLSPGLNIWIKKEELKPIKEINATIWYELQNNKIKLKLSGNVYNSREELIDKMIDKGFSRNNFAKKGSKKNPKSFTLYQKPIQLSNLTIQNIADQYIEFIREIELKMNTI